LSGACSRGEKASGKKGRILNYPSARERGKEKGPAYSQNFPKGDGGFLVSTQRRKSCLAKGRLSEEGFSPHKGREGGGGGILDFGRFQSKRKEAEGETAFLGPKRRFWKKKTKKPTLKRGRGEEKNIEKLPAREDYEKKRRGDDFPGSLNKRKQSQSPSQLFKERRRVASARRAGKALISEIRT